MIRTELYLLTFLTCSRLNNFNNFNSIGYKKMPNEETSIVYFEVSIFWGEGYDAAPSGNYLPSFQMII